MFKRINIYFCILLYSFKRDPDTRKLLELNSLSKIVNNY